MASMFLNKHNSTRTLLNLARPVRAGALSRRVSHLRPPSAAAMANRPIAENAEEAPNTQERQHAPGAEYAQNASGAANAENAVGAGITENAAATAPANSRSEIHETYSRFYRCWRPLRVAAPSTVVPAHRCQAKRSYRT